MDESGQTHTLNENTKTDIACTPERQRTDEVNLQELNLNYQILIGAIAF